MDCRQIIKDFLKLNDFDGLFNIDVPCGCEVNDLCPCEGDAMSCEPGYKVPCDGKDCDCGGHDTAWHISQNKPFSTEEMP